jgi:hypothetical protein
VERRGRISPRTLLASVSVCCLVTSLVSSVAHAAPADDGGERWRIAYALVPRDPALIAPSVTVYSIAADGTGPRIVGEYPGRVFDLAWSPAGNRLALTVDRPGAGIENASIELVNVDGTCAESIVGSPSYIGAGFPSFGRDGSLGYETNLLHRPTLPFNTVLAIRDRTGVVSELPATPGDGGPALSPDGVRVAVVNGGRIWTMRASDGGDRRAVGDIIDAHSVEWSPLGDRLAYAKGATLNAPGPPDVHTVDPDGSDDDTLAIGASSPRWSPDGAQLLVTSSVGGFTLMEADGSNPRPVPISIPDTHSIVGPVFTPPDGPVADAGYFIGTADGATSAFGTSCNPPHGPSSTVGLAVSTDRRRAWSTDASGRVTPSPGTPSFGQLDGRLNQPIVGMATTPTGHGYWLVASDGGIFSFGDATFHGSTGNITLNQPIVGMATTPTGHGYWLVARDGGIFSFGDATFHGSTGAIPLPAPIVGMRATSTGTGYWMVTSYGGVLAFGDAPFAGGFVVSDARTVIGIA